jgi:hypothetical protein
MTGPHPSEQTDSSATRHLWGIPGLIGLLLLVVILVWPGMRSAPFSDDVPQLEKSSHYSSWKQIFEPDAFNFYRPVKNTIFMAAASLKDQPVAWHMIGLVAYLAATVGVYRIASVCLSNRRAAWIATAIWALSPACVSTILWLSCANISIGLAIAAIVFECHERAAADRKAAWLAGALAAYAATLMCYETLIAIPGLLFLRDLQQRRIGFDRRTVVRYGLYTLVAVAFLLVRSHFSAKAIGGNDFHSGFGPDTKAIHLTISAPWFLWRHFLMWVFPFGNLELLGSYQWLKSAPPMVLILSWVFLIGLLGVAAFLWKRFPTAAYGILFFLVASFPSGNFLPGFNGPINDAYLTIPSIGLALIIAAVCEKLLREAAKRRREMDSGVAALAAILFLILAWRLPVCGAYFRYWAAVWNEPIKLVLLMSDTRPHQFQSKAYASTLLLTAGYLDQAETLANEVLAEAPWSPLAKLTLARVLAFRGDHAREQAVYQDILSTPNLPQNLHNTATVELAEALAKIPDRREEAAALCRSALGAKYMSHSFHLRAVICLAGIYEAQGLKDKAIATIQKGLGIHRDSPALQKALERLTSR